MKNGKPMTSQPTRRTTNRRHADRSAAASASALVPVTIHLAPGQHAMLQAVADYDEHPSIAAAILDDLEGHVVASAECVFHLSEDATRARWQADGQASAAPAPVTVTTGGETASVGITFTGGAAHAIILAAQRRGVSVEYALRRAICQDVCCWLFDGEPKSEPEVAAMFGLQTEEERR